MSEPEPNPATTRQWSYRWSKPRIVAFLAALGATGSVTAAARFVGVSRNSAYRLRQRLGPDFAAVWNEGAAIGRHRRLAAAWQGDSERCKVTPSAER